MEEMVDIVDEQQKILYPLAKSEAHAKGLLHKTVICEVRDKQGRVILVKQASDRQDPGQYVSPVGGHVRSGESDEDAMKREAMEEIGIEDFPYKKVSSFIYNRFVRNRQENHYFIIYELTCNGELNLGSEAVSYKAFTEQELKEELKAHRERFGASYLAIVEKLYPDLLK